MQNLMQKLIAGLLLVPVLVCAQNAKDKETDRLARRVPAVCFEKIGKITDKSMMKISAHTLAVSISGQLSDPGQRSMSAVQEISGVIEQEANKDIVKNGPFPTVDPMQLRRYMLGKLPKKDQVALLEWVKKSKNEEVWRVMELPVCDAVLSNFTGLSEEMGLPLHEAVPELEAQVKDIGLEREAAIALIEKSNDQDSLRVAVNFADLLRDGTFMKGFMDAHYSPYLHAYIRRFRALGAAGMLERNENAFREIVLKRRQ